MFSEGNLCPMSLPDSSGNSREIAVSAPMESRAVGSGPETRMVLSKTEALGIGVLGLMVVYFLAISWRKWPDPLVDFGQQCYCVWRVSQGASLYHDFLWSYGPFSIFFRQSASLHFAFRHLTTKSTWMCGPIWTTLKRSRKKAH